MAADKKANEQEKARLAKIEDDRLAQVKEEEAKKLAKEKAEAQRKRVEALRPDKEKIQNYIKSVIFSSEPPLLETKEAKTALKLIQESLGDWSKSELNNLQNL